MFPELNPSRRILMGPGPSEVSPRVLRAMSTPLLGYFDPEFLSIMDLIQDMLRQIFRTQNAATLPLSGTGNLGMEAAFSNLIEPGDTAVVGVNGVFGGRMTEMIERLGGQVVKVEAPWGQVVHMEETIRRVRPKVVGVVHAETSTGVWQPVEEIAKTAHEVGALVVMDCVTSLGGCPVEVDAWGIDVAHSGSQKCLGCAPGLAPITFSPRAIEAVKARKTKVQNYYLDILALSQHWCNGGANRTYHHTLPTTLIYGFYEALRIVLEEGLEARFERHRKNHESLVQGIKDMGLELTAERPLWMLNAIRVPDGVDEAAVRAGLLARHGIEIGAAFGPLKGKIWRVGLMGEASRLNNVMLFLAGMKDALDSNRARASR